MISPRISLKFQFQQKMRSCLNKKRRISLRKTKKRIQNRMNKLMQTRTVLARMQTRMTTIQSPTVTMTVCQIVQNVTMVVTHCSPIPTAMALPMVKRWLQELHRPISMIYP